MAALGVGLVALWFNKQPAAHKRWGRWFLWLLSVVIITAAVGAVGFKPRPFLIILTVLTGYQGYSGYRVVRRREQRASLFDRWSAVAVLAGGVGYGLLMPRHGVNWSPAVIYSTLGAVVLVTGYDTVKAFWLHERLKANWLYEHIYKLLAVVNALASTFAGTVLSAYQPYSQLGPTLLFLLAVIYFVRLRRRQRLRAAQFLILLVGLWSQTAVATAQPKPGMVSPGFTLANQFDQPFTVRFPLSKPVILAFSDRRSGNPMRVWLTQLSTSATHQVLPIACTGWVPSFVQKSVRKAFQSHASILIDWNNQVAKSFGYPGEGCLLVCLATNGQVISWEEGVVTEAKLRRLRSIK